MCFVCPMFSMEGVATINQKKGKQNAEIAIGYMYDVFSQLIDCEVNGSENSGSVTLVQK